MTSFLVQRPTLSIRERRHTTIVLGARLACVLIAAGGHGIFTTIFFCYLVCVCFMLCTTLLMAAAGPGEVHVTSLRMFNTIEHYFVEGLTFDLIQIYLNNLESAAASEAPTDGLDSATSTPQPRLEPPSRRTPRPKSPNDGAPTQVRHAHFRDRRDLLDRRLRPHDPPALRRAHLLERLAAAPVPL